jgi:sugar phosphate isomerase/epimerase
MINRRKFIRNTGLTGLSLLALPPAFAGAKKKKLLVGMQLYCVRNEMQKDPSGTLKALADMGYRHVEHANYVGGKFYGYTPAEFKKLLTDLGMTMPSGHTVLAPRHYDAATKTFTDEWKKTIEDAAFMGQNFVISPSMDGKVRKSYNDLMAILEMFNKSGELCKPYGMHFGYHNHDFEFSEKHGDRTLYEIILSETDPALVMQQLDTGNLFNGGANAIEVIKKYPGRFTSLHIKDAIPLPDNKSRYESTVLGKGVSGIQEILKMVSKQKQPPQLIIEQEAYQGMAPMDCMKENLAVMKTWGYA